MKHVNYVAVMICITATICAKAQTTEIFILSTNDVHARIDNFGKLAAYVRSVKQKHPNVYVFNAGDLINGNPAVDEAADKGAPIIDLMNRVPYDVSCMGNHEFENGEEVLQRRIRQSTSVFVDANVKAASNSEFKTLSPYTFLYTKEGIKIAVLGLTAASSNPCLIPNITVLEPVKTALQYRSLRDSCDVMIALTHIGYKADSSLAMAMSGFDVIVGGHSHTEIPHGKIINSVLVNQAGDKLRYVGKTTLILQGRKVIKKTFEMIDLSALTTTDEAIEKVIRRYNSDPRFKVVLSRTKNGFADKEELGSLKADAIASEAKLDIAFDHARNISYSRFPKGDITVGDVYETDPYDYDLLKFDLTPSEIRELLLRSVKKDPQPVLFPSGISYTLKKNDAGKITEVLLKSKNGFLDENRRYSVGMNSFIACHFMKDHAAGQSLGITPEACVIAYLKKHPNINYAGVKRITIQL